MIDLLGYHIVVLCSKQINNKESHLLQEFLSLQAVLAEGTTDKSSNAELRYL